jgi:hypothetical protein
MRHRLLAALSLPALLGLLLAAGSAQEAPPAPVRLIVEAEDFRPVAGDWEAKEWGTNYYANTFAVTFLSRGRYLAAPEQGAVSRAVYAIEVPRDGRFEVWARYEQPYEYSVEFDIEIQQENKTVFQRGYGRRDAPKLWPFGKGFQPQVLWDWGGGDNIVWEGRGAIAHLRKGPATLILKKGPQPGDQAACRHVDVIVLTDDQAGIDRQLKQARYLPLDGWLTQEGTVFLQVTNPAGSPGPLSVQVGPCTEHSPYWVHVRDWPRQLFIGKQAREQPLAPDGLLQPGESSPRVEVGRFFDTLNQFQWKVITLGADGKFAAGRKLRLSFSIPTPDGKGQVLRDEEFTAGPDGAVHFFLDGDIRRTKRIRTVEEDLAQLHKLVKDFPKTGKRPEKYLIYGIMGSAAGLEQSPRVRELAHEIALMLGANTLPEITVPAQNAMIDVRSVPTKDLPAYCEKLKKEGKADRLKVVSLGDEIHIGAAAKSPDDDPAFRDYLKKKGVPPAELGLPSLADAKIELKNKESPLYYHSHLFALERGIAHYKERTDILEAHLPKGILTGANYSPHPYYRPTEGQWVRAFKRRALTLPWSEDYTWQVPEYSTQVNGYLLTALRCGAKYHDLPIHWYAMPHAPGNTPDNLRRAYYTAIGHGAKQLNFFCATPLSIAYTENYVTSESAATWRTIHDLIHETGLFEEVAFPAKVRRGEVGLLLSFAQDLWDADPAYNHERKCLYLALRQSCFGVEFVTEEDIQEGRHKDLKVIWIVGNHLETATARALKEWVKGGGVLVGVAGGGFRNEYNRPMDVLHEVYGIKEQQIDRRDPVIMTKQHLPRLKPLDTITWQQPNKRFPALGFKQTITPAGRITVFATYADGSPAVTLHPYGEGFAYLYGSFIASASVREAIPLRPFDRSPRPEGFNHFLPTQFDSEFIDLVTAPCGTGEVRYDVINSNPLVEVMLLETPTAMAVVLVNWSPKPQDVDITVQFVPPALIRAISIQRGLIPLTRAKVIANFKLRVDVADVVLLVN